jgi:hypothetical protein
MDGANQRFMSGKTQWLANHMILYAVNKAVGNGDPFGQGHTANIQTELPVQDLDLRKVGDIINNGVPGKCYELRSLTEFTGAKNNKPRNVGFSTHSIRAYFLPWGSNQTYCGRLGANADFFFTPTLNGCTFAYHTIGPNAQVAHSNFVNPGTQLVDQNQMDNDLAAKFGGAPPNTLVKATYKALANGLLPVNTIADWRATVVGFRTANSWSFYYQNYEVSTNLVTYVHTTTAVSLCTLI